jgi:hypothetical protein
VAKELLQRTSEAPSGRARLSHHTEHSGGTSSELSVTLSELLALAVEVIINSSQAREQGLNRAFTELMWVFFEDNAAVLLVSGLLGLVTALMAALGVCWLACRRKAREDVK